MAIAPPPKYETTSLRVRPSMLARIDAAATRREMTRSDYIRLVLEQALAQDQPAGPQLPNLQKVA